MVMKIYFRHVYSCRVCSELHYCDRNHIENASAVVREQSLAYLVTAATSGKKSPPESLINRHSTTSHELPLRQHHALTFPEICDNSRHRLLQAPTKHCSLHCGVGGWRVWGFLVVEGEVREREGGN